MLTLIHLYLIMSYFPGSVFFPFFINLSFAVESIFVFFNHIAKQTVCVTVFQVRVTHRNARATLKTKYIFMKMCNICYIHKSN